jgi:transposase
LAVYHGRCKNKTEKVIPDNFITFRFYKVLVGLSGKSVKKLRKEIEDGESNSLFHVAGGGRKSKLTDVEIPILEEIKSGAYHSHQQIADKIKKKYGIKVSLPVIGRLLKKTGLDD